MSSSLHSFTYLRSSALHTESGTPRLSLETCGGLTSHGLAPFPRFFSGFLTAPEAAAGGLLAVADVAATRYHQPRDRASLDPVVTGNGDRLRFESFSGCGGVYARLDVLAAGIDGDMLGTGTTNVDVNAPLREALAMVGGADPLHLAVGPDDVTVTTFDGPVVEKKVPLPERWLRGFAEVQVISSRFDQRAELGAVDAVRFLRALPRGARTVLWVRPFGRTLRAAPGPGPGAVCLAGPDRLRALTRILRHARALRVYGPAVTAANAAPAASAWEVELPGMRLTLTLSPDPARGFSGEGAVLGDLARDEADADADLIAALLAWEPRVEVGDLARESGLPPERVRAALVRLGTGGRIGYDVAEAAYFHRELPYDTGRVERMNPRLRDARRLVDTGAVTGDGERFQVVSGPTTYQVRLHGDGTCTCEWWTAHRGGRGPCKHVLGAQITVRRAADAATPATAEEATR